MSILKRLIAEDLASLLRRRAPDSAREPAAVADGAADGAADRAILATATVPARATGAGMKVVILNWNAGENDPFSVENAAIRQHFRACGKNVETLEIAADGWVERLGELAATGVEFAFTWQGLGSSATIDSESVWERFGIPLVCVHGDHPSHMPLNHRLESRFCFHLYTNAEFARYSNRHFRRAQGASVIDIPQLHREPPLGPRSGDHFVIAKNIDDPAETERVWRQCLPPRLADAYLGAAEALKARIACESYVEIHDALDEFLAGGSYAELNPDAGVNAYHQYHSQLEHYLHSYKTVRAVDAIRDFPARVYGRGWNRIAMSAPACHTFAAGLKMADSQNLYYSRFGLIDISPSKGLHDRTRRAMVNKAPFLSSANLEDSFPDIDTYEPLFFSFGTDSIAAKCASVVDNPDAHREVAVRFADAYHTRFHFKRFVSCLEQLAALAHPIERVPRLVP